ncbi:hypothetical protein CQW23_19700 [Capsicum baccatum]|uniref:Uncharacterized protein n=1 Tax=Capsicum baccatum TaxID=33114 RepID=A0A2G2W6J6_CAPBA|nr:hypothetical protein CQW23_19700 [Capsicum baccatum]
MGTVGEFEYEIWGCHLRSHLVSVDVRTGETRPLGFRQPGLNKGLWNETVCSVHIYKESLVTIKRELQLN